MKKSLYLLLLAALTVGFIACGDKSNGPSDDGTLTPAALVGSKWRTDSVKVNGAQQPAPHFIVEVLSTSRAVINGDTVNYSISDNKLTCNKGTYEVADYARTTAKLLNNGQEMFICRLPDLDMEAQKIDFTEDDIIGTWKYAYCRHTNINMSTHEVTHFLSTNRGVETWTFQKNGNVIYHNTYTGVTEYGAWDLNGGIKFHLSPVDGQQDDHMAVQPLTNKWMGNVKGDGTSYSNQWWYYKVD